MGLFRVAPEHPLERKFRNAPEHLLERKNHDLGPLVKAHKKQKPEGFSGFALQDGLEPTTP